MFARSRSGMRVLVSYRSGIIRKNFMFARSRVGMRDLIGFKLQGEYMEPQTQRQKCKQFTKHLPGGLLDVVSVLVQHCLDLGDFLQVDQSRAFLDNLQQVVIKAPVHEALLQRVLGLRELV